MFSRNAQPKIVIFADRQSFIESANPVEQPTRHHHSRGADQAKLKATTKNVSRRFSMLHLRVDPEPSTHPNLIGLADLNSWMPLHEPSLDLEFLRQPKIVGIEKCKIAPARDAHSPVSRCRYAFLGLANQSQTRAELGEFCVCAIRRAIINDDDLKMPVALSQN